MISLVACNTNNSTPKQEEQPKPAQTEIKSSDKNTLKTIRNIVLTPIGSLPHDNRAYTQGLLYSNGILYEGTGEYGFSSVRKLNPKTGEVQKKISVNFKYFGEGIALYKDKIYELTWKAGVCNVYDANSLQYLNSFRYTGEGWGITNVSNDKLVMSDGSSTLKFINPADFSVIKSIDVVENGALLVNINELENVKGEIWGNIWYEDRVVRIDPNNGNALGSLDFSFLRNDQANNPNAEVLNGIAFDEASSTLYVTGKNWDKIYLFKVDFQY